ncbi:hypothetical protein FHL15_004490 [Xylaria flabelliformis]|uniref:Rhodopsin domain-containing protein n=1 Tax=Xylaria flabelliformis TaxID=2512241 RepID=A0A553I3E5_9PEZI|nr:hypothetical protein FHL15_004490 [Xylaria flabelliformis]
MDTTAMMSNSRGPALLAVSVTTIAIALLTCMLRYWVQSRINRTVGWEDYFVGGAMLLGIIGVSFAIVESVSQGDLRSALQFDYLAQPWLNMGSTLSKVSMCLFARRLVARARVWRVVLSVEIILLLLVNLAYTFTTLLQCRPLEKLWKPEIPGRCWDLSIQQDIGYSQGAFDVVTQLFIALFPIVAIQDLEIPRNFHETRMFEVIATILAVLEQNLNIISANIIPISSFCSKTIRPISRALNDAASSREIDTVSIISKKSQGSKVEGRQSGASNMMVEVMQRASSESISSVSETAVADTWPLGIIKTVSIEVVEEDAAKISQNPDNSDNRSASRQQNWDSYLQ